LGILSKRIIILLHVVH